MFTHIDTQFSILNQNFVGKIAMGIKLVGLFVHQIKVYEWNSNLEKLSGFVLLTLTEI